MANHVKSKLKQITQIWIPVLSHQLSQDCYIAKCKNVMTSEFHYSDIIMGAMASQITSLTIVTQLFIQEQIKANIKYFGVQGNK